MKTYYWFVAAIAAALLVPLGCEVRRVTTVEHREVYVVPPPPVSAPPPPVVVQAPPPPVSPAPQYEAPVQVPPPPSYAAPAQMVVQTRGQVHEAFAEPIQNQPEAGLLINREPPAPIQELPPLEQPVGLQALWIPGYWGWDDDRDDFVWISGIWRVAPPGCVWVSGYWAQTNQGYLWVPGYWVAQTVQEVEYLPPPPAPIEVAPVGVAPSVDSVWVSGCWYWQQQRYVWRPGIWMAARSEWIWTPAHYIWTPRGYLFVDGHWDYALERRGLVFAPVYIERAVYMRPGFYYQPTVVIDMGPMVLSLFARPLYNHYYFGDYYEVRYTRMGIYPWYASYTDHRWNDPIYGHERWQHLKQDPRWDDHQRQEYDRRFQDRDARPPRTFVEQQDWVRTHPQADQHGRVMAQPLKEFAAGKQAGVRFETLNKDQRQVIEKHGREDLKNRTERAKIEMAAPPTKAPLKLPRPGATVGPRPEEKGKNVPEPKRIETPPVTPPTPKRVEEKGKNTPEPKRIETPVLPPEPKRIENPAMPSEPKRVEEKGKTAPEPKRFETPVTPPEPKRVVDKGKTAPEPKRIEAPTVTDPEPKRGVEEKGKTAPEPRRIETPVTPPEPKRVVEEKGKTAPEPRRIETPVRPLEPKRIEMPTLPPEPKRIETPATPPREIVRPTLPETRSHEDRVAQPPPEPRREVERPAPPEVRKGSDTPPPPDTKQPEEKKGRTTKG